MGPPWPTPLTDAVHLGARFSPTERAPQPPNPSAQSTARSLVPFQASFSSSPPFPLGTKFPFFFQSFEPITRHSLSFPSALALVFFFSVLSFAPAPPSQSLPGAFEEREKKKVVYEQAVFWTVARVNFGSGSSAELYTAQPIPSFSSCSCYRLRPHCPDGLDARGTAIEKEEGPTPPVNHFDRRSARLFPRNALPIAGSWWKGATFSFGRPSATLWLADRNSFLGSLQDWNTALAQPTPSPSQQKAAALCVPSLTLQSTQHRLPTD